MSEASVQSNNTANSNDIHNHLKRAASNDIDELKDSKSLKLDYGSDSNSNNPELDTTPTISNTAATSDEAVQEKKHSQVNIDPAVAAAAAAATAAAAHHQQQQQQHHQQQQQHHHHQQHDNTNNDNTNQTDNNNNSNLMTMTSGHHSVPPPPGLHLLTDPQQQQLLQSYVAQAQAQGQDLANLTASSLAQAMVSPIAVPSLASNLLQQLQQGGNVITALPGPPQMAGGSPPNNIHPHLQQQPQNTNGIVDENGNNGMKRANARTLSNDERRQRRLLRNRVAAKECRKKKKQHIHEMEEKIVQLEDENLKLKMEVEELQAKLSTGGSLGGSESYRLMKEVEELNAKLGMGVPLPTGSALTAAVMAASQQQQQQQQQATKSDESPTTSTVTAGTSPSTTSTPPITSTTIDPTTNTSATTNTTLHNDTTSTITTANETNNTINNNNNDTNTVFNVDPSIVN